MSTLIRLVCLVALVFATSLPLFSETFFRVHDYVHGARVAEMSTALSEGHFPVRWSKNFSYGYGMPLFQFYGPLPYYVASGFFLTGVSLVSSVKVLFFLSNLGTAIGAFKLGQKINGDWAGIATAAIVTLAPYRALNLYIRGAVSEAWGMMFVVWLIWAVVSVLKSEKANTKGWLMIALSSAGVVLSHNLTAVMAGVILGLFILGWLLTLFIGATKLAFTESVQKMRTVVLGGVLGFGISAFYILPAFLEKSYTKVDQFVLSEYFAYNKHILYVRQFFRPGWGYGGSQEGPDDPISFFLGFPQLLILVVAGVVSLNLFLGYLKSKSLKNVQKDWMLVFSLIGVAVSLFLTLGHSLPIWNSISIFEYLQFPWRWLSMAVIFTGVVTASLFSVSQIRKGATWITVVLVIGTIVFNYSYFRPDPESWLDQPEDLYYQDAEKISTNMSSILPDYIPATLADDIEPSFSRVSSVSSDDPVLEIDRTHQALISIEQPVADIEYFAVADFPGWRVELDGTPEQKVVSEDGLIGVLVPEGSHKVGLIFSETWLRTISNLISITSVLILLYVVLYQERNEYRA